ncbi:MAG TPA: hypothetical protein VK690_01735 [Stellaceae bacterium]|jgi:hypothetical protein|nr:hypothetical protein [Stellaceae bacterium]
MGAIFVARSVKFGKWASDVGLSKHVFKLGYSDEDPKDDVARGWAGADDWALLTQEKADGLSEAQVVERAQRKIKMIDPKYYPRLKDAIGLFKVDPVAVENHMLVARALRGEAESLAFKLTPADFAAYLIALARPGA